MTALARDQRLCRNFLCILRSLDRHELVAAGVLTESSGPEVWDEWVRDPLRAYLRLDDSREAACFDRVQMRLKPDLRAGAVPA